MEQLAAWRRQRALKENKNLYFKTVSQASYCVFDSPTLPEILLKLTLPSTDYPTVTVTAPSHILDSIVCVCVCVSPPPWFISSDGALFLQAMTVYWESDVWASNDCFHQFLTCVGLWRPLSNYSNVTQSSLIKSHHRSLVLMVCFCLCTHVKEEPSWTLCKWIFIEIRKHAAL